MQHCGVHVFGFSPPERTVERQACEGKRPHDTARLWSPDLGVVNAKNGFSGIAVRFRRSRLSICQGTYRWSIILAISADAGGGSLAHDRVRRFLGVKPYVPPTIKI